MTEWLFCICRSNILVDQVIPDQEKSTYPAVGDNAILDSLIPLPPLEEQRRIVERIEALTRRVEEVRKELAQADAELAAFTPALLAKAFRGEL